MSQWGWPWVGVPLGSHDHSTWNQNILTHSIQLPIKQSLPWKKQTTKPPNTNNAESNPVLVGEWLLFPDKNTCKTHSCSTKIVTPSLVFCGTSGCLSRTRSSAHGTGSTSQKRRIAMDRSYVIQTTRRSLNYQVFDVGMLDRLHRAYGYTMMNSWQVVLLSEVGMVTSNEWLKKVTTWIIWNFQCFSKFQRFPLSKLDLNMWWKFRKPCPALWWFCHRNTNQPVFHMFKLSGWFCFPKSKSTKGLLLPTLPGSFNGHDALVFQLFWSLKFHCFRSWWQQKAPNIFTKWATD